MRPKGNPAVMLLDLKLPKVDGFEVIQQVRADEKLKMIPVVVLTSSHEEKDFVRSYKLGANGYVVKPVDFHRFVNAVKELGVFWGCSTNRHLAVSQKRSNLFDIWRVLSCRS